MVGFTSITLMARSQLRRTAQTRYTIAQMEYLKRRAVKLNPANPSISEAVRADVENGRLRELAETECDKLSQQAQAQQSTMSTKARAA